MTGSPPGTCTSKFVIWNSTTSNHIKVISRWRHIGMVTTGLPLQLPYEPDDASFERPDCQDGFPDRRLQFRKHTHLRIRVHTEPLFVALTSRSQNRPKLRTFTSGASASGFQSNRPRETLDILTFLAFPSHRTLLLRPVHLLEHRIGLVTNRSERRHHRLVRPVHRFSSIC